MSVPRQVRLCHLKWLHSSSFSFRVSKIAEDVGDGNRQDNLPLPCEVLRLR